jgi:CheY-like chemotaxis protein
MRFKELPEEQRSRSRDVIERQVDQLVRLIDDLMDVSRITRGMITLHREPIDLTAVIARAVETTRPLVDHYRQELQIALPARALRVDGDATRLAQVIGNVLNNASKYTPEGGRIRLQLHAEGSEAVITVTDNGIGVPAEMLGKIFDLFTQVNRALDRAHGGLGIGLALVRRIVEMHGGTVTASSAGVDQGTEVQIRLGLLAAADTESELPQVAEGSELRELAPRRVLVVDDNEDAAALIALLLDLGGHEVRTANSGTAALVAAAELRPDVVFLDLSMPGLNGYETARRIRQEAWGRDVALIALSGWGQRRDRALTAEAGFVAHLVKPVSELQILSVLAQVQPQPAGQSGAMTG